MPIKRKQQNRKAEETVTTDDEIAEPEAEVEAEVELAKPKRGRPAKQTSQQQKVEEAVDPQAKRPRGRPKGMLSRLCKELSVPTKLLRSPRSDLLTCRLREKAA